MKKLLYIIAVTMILSVTSPSYGLQFIDNFQSSNYTLNNTLNGLNNSDQCGGVFNYDWGGDSRARS